MEKYIYDKSNGLWYELQSVYRAADQRQAEYLPCRHQRTGGETNAPADEADSRA